MKNTISHPALFVAAMALTCLAGDPFAVPWYTIDGGGAMRSTSGDGRFILSGTIGQPDAGAMTGGNFKLTGGFWHETPPGDCNQDGIVGLADQAAIVDCLSGPIGFGLSLQCECFDVDGSGTIDLFDFAQIQVSFVGN